MILATSIKFFSLSRPLCRPSSSSSSSTMAWRSSADSNDGLVDNLVRNKMLPSEQDDPALVAAFRAVDRAQFVRFRDAAYQDSPQNIDRVTGATISAPHMHALATQHLRTFLQPGMRVLDVGSGSGYLTQVMAELVGGGGTSEGDRLEGQQDSTGKAVGIEHVGRLRDWAEDNVRKTPRGRSLLEYQQIVFVQGDGRQGWPSLGPYDAIHVGAAAAREVPDALVAQLKAPGRIFVPVEEGTGRSAAGGDDRRQYIWTVDKDSQGT